MNINLYPYSKGDPSVGIGSWDCVVTIELPSDDIEEGDLEFFKKQVAGIYEFWDCDGVDDDIDRNNMELHENDMEIYYLSEKKTKKNKKEIEKIEKKNKELKEKNKELVKLFKLENKK